MPPHAAPRGRPPLVTLAAAAWAVLLVAAVGRVLLLGGPRHTSNYAETFAAAGRAWAAGADLYPPAYHGTAFPYSPLYGPFFAAFGVLPDAAGNAVWRCCLTGAFLTALAAWARAFFPDGDRTRTLARLALLVIPCVAPSLLVGQPSVLLVSLLLAAMTAAAAARWRAAALAMAAAVLMKVYPVAAALLLAAARPRRFAGPFLAALALAAALPFLFQAPGYVADQYAGWVRILGEARAHPWYQSEHNRDVRVLLNTVGVRLGPAVYLAVELAAAAGAAGLCAAARRRVASPAELLQFVLAAAGLWMTVFGPAVETFGYALVAPSLAWLVVRAWGRPGWASRAAAGGSFALFTASAAGAWFPFGTAFSRLGVQPLAGLLLLAAALLELRQHRGPAAAARDAREPARRAA